MDRDDVIATLNDLIETSKDGEQGFRKCAENASDPELKAFFTQAAARCAEGARELQSQVRQWGGDPDTTGSMGGALHRGWMDVKTAVTGQDDVAVLEECERGEDTAKEHYQDALENEDLPSDVRQMIERQYQGVVENHDRVRELRNRYRRVA